MPLQRTIEAPTAERSAQPGMVELHDLLAGLGLSLGLAAGAVTARIALRASPLNRPV